MRSPEVCFPLSPRDTESLREDRSEVTNYNMYKAQSKYRRCKSYRNFSCD